MTDPFWKDTDRISVGERGIDGGEGLGVLRDVHTLIEFPVDRYRSGSGDKKAEWTVKERRLREEPHVPAGRRPDDGGIEQRIGVIGQQQRRAGRWRRTDAINSIEQVAGCPGEKANERGDAG